MANGKNLSEKIKGVGDTVISIVKVIPAAIGAVATLNTSTPYGSTIDVVKKFDGNMLINHTKLAFLGVDYHGNFDSKPLAKTYTPIAVGVAMSGFVSALVDFVRG